MAAVLIIPKTKDVVFVHVQQFAFTSEQWRPPQVVGLSLQNSGKGLG